MKLALLSESPADEAAIRLVAEAVLGPGLAVLRPPMRARGWPSVAQVLPAILRHLHFRTDAVGLVVVVDSDDSVPHDDGHEGSGRHHPGCRLCQLRAIARQTLKRVPPAHGRARLLTAIGLAVPAIEAWLLCGRDPEVTEAAWAGGLARGATPYTRAELKERVYGTRRPSLPFETARAVAEISRHRGDLRRLENDFPGGFGPLVRDLRSWPRPGAEGP